MPKAPKKGGFYAVAKGFTPGIYTSWPDAEAQVKGFAGAAHKKFGSMQDAQAYLNGSSSSANARASTQRPAARARAQATPYNPFNAKEQRDGAPTPRPNMRHVYSDGACKDNGKPQARAGVGVFWEDRPETSLSEKLPGSQQTNQKAELYAILRVLETDPHPDQDLEILTDSKWCINCLSLWHRKWAKNGWKTSTGTPVEHKALLQLVLHRINMYPKRKLVLTYVRGHAGIEGNEAADTLAVKASTLPKIPDRNYAQELAELKREPQAGPQDEVQAEIEAVMDPSLWLSEEQMANGDFD